MSNAPSGSGLPRRMGHASAIDPTRPFGMADELIQQDLLEEHPAWMPLGEGEWMRPLVLNPVQGSWASLFKVLGARVLGRHRHLSPVTGWTVSGAWGYLERDWIARAGSFIFEPAGDTHTLFVDKDAGHMIAVYHMYGPSLSIDERGEVTDYTDVTKRTEQYLKHCESVGLGESFVRSIIR
jgi:2,4'-dihydroxyacetophenone dioxygenase